MNKSTTFKEARTLFFSKAYDEIFNQLRLAVSLGKDKSNNDEEYKKVIASVKDKVDYMLDNDKLDEHEAEEKVFDRTILPKFGENVAENDAIRLIVISEKERNDYLTLFSEYSCLNSCEQTDNALWNSTFNDNSFVCSIYDKNTNKYVGYCLIRDLKSSVWEIAIEEKKEFCNKGYGTYALDLFMNVVTKFTGNRYYRARVDVDNYPSQALMKKLGAVPNGISEYMLHGEDLKKFQKEYSYLINDNIRNVAKEFGVQAEKLIGHVLEYKFDRGNK